MESYKHDLNKYLDSQELSIDKELELRDELEQELFEIMARDEFIKLSLKAIKKASKKAVGFDYHNNELDDITYDLAYLLSEKLSEFEGYEFMFEDCIEHAIKRVKAKKVASNIIATVEKIVAWISNKIFISSKALYLGFCFFKR